MNIGTLLAVAIGCLIVGYVVGQNTRCISIFGATTCVVSNPLK